MIDFAGIRKSTILGSKIDGLKYLYLQDESETDVYQSLSRINYTFTRFFNDLSSPIFIPVLIKKWDVVSEKLYNANLKNIFTDINAFYLELKTLTEAHIATYNYATVITASIISKADSLASTVLDLNILNQFTRSDTIVAGDDFKNLDYVDTSAGTAAPQAELLLDGGGIGLAKQGLQDIVDENTKINITPIAPISQTDSSVNLKPTPGNFERFYEGNYYNFMGEARPEGGEFNLRYITNPEERDYTPDVPKGDVRIFNSTKPTKKIIAPDDPDSYFMDFGATEDVKQIMRLKMFDKDANTFWECEYLYKTPALFEVGSSDTNQEVNDQADGVEDTNVINIDLDQANDLAQKYDYTGRDLIIELVITFPEEKSINFVALNPIIFGQSTFPSVLDIATVGAESDQFITVDGWENNRFSKTITPEANEFLTDSQLGLTLAPTRATYKGQGIYPFPYRRAKKVRLLISMPEPIAQPYDKTLVMLKKTIDIEGTVKTTTKKGIFA